MKKEITTTQYQEGIFDVCEFLVRDMIEFLKEERRYKFKMIEYMNTVQTLFDNAHKSQTEKDINIYGRVLYILRKAIIRDYQRLRMKRLTPADSLICIILKLIKVSETLEGSQRFSDEQTQIKTIIQKLHENIRNKGKNDNLWKIENAIRDSVAVNKWGTLSLDELDIYHVEHPIEKSPEMTGEKNNWGETGKEVNF